MSCLSRFLAPLMFVVAPLTIAAADDLPGLAGVRRIVFLGDSITHSGQYIETIDSDLAARYPDHPRELLNLGLPNETVSGLSEPGHAGGKFPRPDLHERLERVQVGHPTTYGRTEKSGEAIGNHRIGIESGRPNQPCSCSGHPAHPLQVAHALRSLLL